MNARDQRISHLSQEGQQILQKADGRELTPRERGRVTEIHSEITELREAEAKSTILDDHVTSFLSGEQGRIEAVPGSGGETMFASPGDRLVNSAGFKAIAGSGTRGQRYSSGPIEVSSGALGSGQYKSGTLFESGQGAGLIPVPQVVPGQVEKLFQPLGLADPFNTGTATTSSFRYTVEGTATSGAAGVAEGGAKPASDLTLSTVDEPVKKIATSLITSDELLDDVASVRSYVDSRLTLFVKAEEERQLLRGAGTNELVGIIGRSGVNTYSKLAADDNAVCLAKTIYNTRGSSFLQPDLVVMHPANYLTMRLLRDGTGGTVGQFYGGGPFTGAYGNGGAVGLVGESIWNTMVFLSTVVGNGTAVVDSFTQAAQIMRRGGVTVEATNSHAELFLTDQVAIRAEERLGLACYRPSAFTVVSGLS